MHDLTYKAIKPKRTLKNQEKDQQMNQRSLMNTKQVIDIMIDQFRTKFRIITKV